MKDADSGHRVSIHGDAEVWPVSAEWSTRTPGATATRPLVTRASTYEEAAIAEALKFSRNANTGRRSSRSCSNRDSLERRISPPPSTNTRVDREYVQSARYIRSLRRARCSSRPFMFVLRNLF